MLERRSFLKFLGIGAVSPAILEQVSHAREPVKVPEEKLVKELIKPKWVDPEVRLCLLNANSLQVREEQGKAGEWVIIDRGKVIQNLGPKIQVRWQGYRFKAMKYRPSTGEEPIVTNDFESVLFQEIYKKSIENRFLENNWVYLAGIELDFELVGHDKVLPFFCSTKTLKRFCADIYDKSNYGDSALVLTLTSRQLKARDFTWYAPECELHTPHYPFENNQQIENKQVQTILYSKKREHDYNPRPPRLRRRRKFKRTRSRLGKDNPFAKDRPDVS